MNTKLYNTVVNIVKTLPSGTIFELDKKFYNFNGLSATNGEKRSIGKEFRKAVENQTILNVEKYIINNCSNCVNKKTDNHRVYIKK